MPRQLRVQTSAFVPHREYDIPFCCRYVEAEGGCTNMCTYNLDVCDEYQYQCTYPCTAYAPLTCDCNCKSPSPLLYPFRSSSSCTGFIFESSTSQFAYFALFPSLQSYFFLFYFFLSFLKYSESYHLRWSPLFFLHVPVPYLQICTVFVIL